VNDCRRGMGLCEDCGGGEERHFIVIILVMGYVGDFSYDEVKWIRG
jgi:hypothetical protein